MVLVVELLLELLFDGAMEGAICRKTPRPLRIILILFLTALYLGLLGIFLYIIVTNEDVLLKIFLTTVTGALLFYFYKIWRTFCNLKKKR
jgi:hypothetical protein